MILDADNLPINIGDRLLHVVDDQLWEVFALHPGEAMQVYLTREPLPTDETRRVLMCACDGKGFRRAGTPGAPQSSEVTNGHERADRGIQAGRSST